MFLSVVNLFRTPQTVATLEGLGKLGQCVPDSGLI